MRGCEASVDLPDETTGSSDAAFGNRTCRHTMLKNPTVSQICFAGRFVAFLSRNRCFATAKRDQFSLNSRQAAARSDNVDEASIIDRFCIFSAAMSQLVGYNSAESDMQATIQQDNQRDMAPAFCKRPGNHRKGLIISTREIVKPI